MSCGVLLFCKSKIQIKNKTQHKQHTQHTHASKHYTLNCNFIWVLKMQSALTIHKQYGLVLITHLAWTGLGLSTKSEPHRTIGLYSNWAQIWLGLDSDWACTLRCTPKMDWTHTGIGLGSVCNRTEPCLLQSISCLWLQALTPKTLVPGTIPL